MAKIEKLQNVCYQNVLPTAFDDSRSYIETLYQVIYKVNELIESDETQYDSIEQRVGTLETWKASVESTIQVLQNANQQIQSQIQQFKYTQDDHTKKISDLENWKSTTDSAIKVLQETSQHVQSQITQITSWQSATDTRILNVESEYTEIKGQFDAIQKSTTENSNAISTINESIKTLQETSQHVQSQISQLTTSQNESGVKISSLETSVEDINDWKDQVSVGLIGLIDQPDINHLYSGIIKGDSDEENFGTWNAWVNNSGFVFNISANCEKMTGTSFVNLYLVDEGQSHNDNSTELAMMILAWAKYKGLYRVPEQARNRVINENFQNIVYANAYENSCQVIAECDTKFVKGTPYHTTTLILHAKSMPEPTFSFSFNLTL